MITSIIIFCSIVFFVLTWLNSYEKYDLDKIPGPKGIPILGNVFDLLTDRGENIKFNFLKYRGLKGRMG